MVQMSEMERYRIHFESYLPLVSVDGSQNITDMVLMRAVTHNRPSHNHLKKNDSIQRAFEDAIVAFRM